MAETHVFVGMWAYFPMCVWIQYMQYICEHSLPMYISMVLSLTFTRKKDTPYVCRDLASFTYFTFASISVISPQFLWSWTNNSSYISPSLDWSWHALYVTLCDLNVLYSVNLCLNREQMTIIPTGPPTVSNTLFSLNVTFEQCNVHTWNIFFSDPLCLMYSLGRNSFRLWT